MGVDAGVNPAYTVTEVPLTLTIENVDVDSDGLSDAWARAHFGDLTTVDTTTRRLTMMRRLHRPAGVSQSGRQCSRPRRRRI